MRWVPFLWVFGCRVVTTDEVVKSSAGGSPYFSVSNGSETLLPPSPLEAMRRDFPSCNSDGSVFLFIIEGQLVLSAFSFVSLMTIIISGLPCGQAAGECFISIPYFYAVCFLTAWQAGPILLIPWVWRELASLREFRRLLLLSLGRVVVMFQIREIYLAFSLLMQNVVCVQRPFGNRMIRFLTLNFVFPYGHPFAPPGFVPVFIYGPELTFL